MKEIFDWLREQINAKIVKSPTNNEDWFRDECVRNNAYQNALDIINEAEAKWEKEVCEWKETGFSEPTRYFEAHDLMAYELDICLWNYCPICGKPIKIVEVE